MFIIESTFRSLPVFTVVNQVNGAGQEMDGSPNPAQCNDVSSDVIGLSHFKAA